MYSEVSTPWMLEAADDTSLSLYKRRFSMYFVAFEILFSLVKRTWCCLPMGSDVVML